MWAASCLLLKVPLLWAPLGVVTALAAPALGLGRGHDTACVGRCGAQCGRMQVLSARHTSGMRSWQSNSFRKHSLALLHLEKHLTFASRGTPSVHTQRSPAGLALAVHARVTEEGVGWKRKSARGPARPECRVMVTSFAGFIATPPPPPGPRHSLRDK